MKKRNCLKQVSPTGRKETMSEINREPVPEDKIRETHAHRGTSIIERGSGNARHSAQGGGGALEHFTDETCPPDRRRSTSRERKEKKKGSAEGLKESSHVSASRR